MGMNFFFFFKERLNSRCIQHSWECKTQSQREERRQGQKWCFRKPNTLTSMALRLKHSGSLPVLSLCCSVDDFEDLIVKLLSALVAVTVPRHCCLKTIICCPVVTWKSVSRNIHFMKADEGNLHFRINFIMFHELEMTLWIHSTADPCGSVEIPTFLTAFRYRISFNSFP